MKLSGLLEGVSICRWWGNTTPETVEINDIVDDSRKVLPGSLFVAVQGTKEDGYRFIEDAVGRGAVAVVAGRPAEGESASGVCWVQVEDSREVLVPLAEHFFGYPARGLRLVGVTGTNGKTTTCFLGRAILEEGDGKAGLLGTVFYDVGEGPEPAPRTTPGVLALQRLFQRMQRVRIDRVVMEVSSHGLDQGRVDGCRFSTAVFTNLSQDHLDYHKTMEHYFSAKKRLFEEYCEGTAVVNVDDPFGKRLVDLLKTNFSGRILTYAMEERADLSPLSLQIDREGIAMRLATDAGPLEFSSPLIGRYNAYNLLAGVGIGLSEGLSPETIVQGIAKLRSVPGRFERVDVGQDFQVVVDYAHTEDALNRLLEAASALKPHRVLTLFGCGGERDLGKRPKMGRVAALWSDLVILTSDNPRGEDPEGIIREVEEGITALSREAGKEYQYEVVVDRFKAIEQILSLAGPGDLVVIAGKGHENEQTIGERRIPFDDLKVARGILQKIVKG